MSMSENKKLIQQDLFGKKVKLDNYAINENIEISVERGDVYQLGKHRLMCGDSTNINDVEKLTRREHIDICFTSPPYNTNKGMETNPLSKLNHSYYKETGQNKQVGLYNEYNDNLSDEDYSKLLIDSAKLGLEFADDVMYNIGILSGSKEGIIEMLYELKDNFCDILIWDKKFAMPMGLESQKRLVSHPCELIFCFNQTGSRNFTHSQWEKGTMTNKITTENASKNKLSEQHKATFPLSFASEIVKNFSYESVLDLFGGTGTTLISCEQLERKCYMMEIDPYYCQIIINRWENFTGNKSKKGE